MVSRPHQKIWFVRALRAAGVAAANSACMQFDVLIAFEPHKKHVEPLRKELIEIKRVSMQTNK